VWPRPHFLRSHAAQDPVFVPPGHPAFPPSYNVAPSDNLPIVRYDPKSEHRTLDLMRWGLIPYWPILGASGR
jgi:putative SOS response-associated peptidase YedK